MDGKDRGCMGSSFVFRNAKERGDPLHLHARSPGPSTPSETCMHEAGSARFRSNQDSSESPPTPRPAPRDVAFLSSIASSPGIRSFSILRHRRTCLSPCFHLSSWSKRCLEVSGCGRMSESPRRDSWQGGVAPGKTTGHHHHSSSSSQVVEDVGSTTCTRDARAAKGAAVRLVLARDRSVPSQTTRGMKTCTTTTRPTVNRSLPTVLRAKGDKTFRCKVASNGTRVVALMNFGKKLRMDSESAGVFASQGRDDYSESDVQYYFEYAGMLAVEKTYDKMDQLLATGVAPVDLLLLMAASEGDRQKIEELMRAGASYEIKDTDGRTALDRACDDEIRELILSLSN